MGNSYSVAQEEREEAEFERLVRAVERAQRGDSESSVPHDLEAQYHYAEPEEGPPRPEKVMRWFRAARGNRATIQAELDPSPIHPVATPAGISNSVALEPTSVPPSIVCQPPSLSPRTPSTRTSPSPSPSPSPQLVPVVVCCPPSPAASTTPSISAEPSCRSVRSSTSDDSSSAQGPLWLCPPARTPGEAVAIQQAETEPIENDEGRADDGDDKLNNSSVDELPSLVVPHRPLAASPVQSIAIPEECQPSVVPLVPPTAQVVPPRPIVPIPASAITPIPVFGGPLTELRGRSRSRTLQRERYRSRSRSRRPGWPAQDSLTNFRDLFYRPTQQHEHSPSSDVSRGRSPVWRQDHSRHASPAPATPSASETLGSQHRAPPANASDSRSPSLYRFRRRVEFPSRSRSPSRQAASSSRLSRSPDSIIDRRPVKIYHRRARTRSPSRRSSSRSIHITVYPPSVRQGSPSNTPSRSPSPPALQYIPDPRSKNPRRRMPGDLYDDDFRRTRSPPLVRPSVQSQYSVHREPSLEGSNVSSASPSYRPSRTPFQEGGRPLPPRTADDLDADISFSRTRTSVQHSSWRHPPAPVQPPVIIIPPPQQAAPPRPQSTRSPTHSRSRSRRARPDKFKQVLQLYEKTLLDHERRAELWHEHSKQLIGVVRRLEKHLVALRCQHRHGSASADSLPLSLLDLDEKFADEKDGLQSLAYTGPRNGPIQAKPYPSRPYAAGLPVRRCSDDWQPKWDVFPLKAFRGSSYTYLKINAGWDDAALLRELGRSYDKLRTVWRKWFSLRSVRSISMVYADHTCVYPRRIGPAGVSPSKNMRLRYFLRHPDQMKDRHEFMQVLTARTDLGIEFVEGWQLTRIAVAILLPVFASLVLAVLYSALYGDVSGAFTIAGYMTSAYSVCLVLLGLLNFVEF